eukprot:9379153-Ditylum_brightwellii.AAC.2
MLEKAIKTAENNSVTQLGQEDQLAPNQAAGTEEHAAAPAAHRITSVINDNPVNILHVEDISEYNDTSTDYSHFSPSYYCSNFAHRIATEQNNNLAKQENKTLNQLKEM